MDKEQQILEFIRLNPYISQQELAQKVGLSRPAVANYIANLTKSGIIRGRAYVINEKPHILCIGGANVDRKAKSKQSIQLYSSNPVSIHESCGGVARNVTENLTRLGSNTTILTSLGQDKEGSWLLQEMKQIGIDVSQVWILDSERTGTYTALLDTNGEMIVSMADMNIYDQISPNMLLEKTSTILAAKAVFIDTNLSAECLEFIVKFCDEHNIKLYVDPVSSSKATKLPHDLSGVNVIMPNKEEAELMSGEIINDVTDCSRAALKIRERGAENVIITLGTQGVFYSSTEEEGHIPAINVQVVDVTGAGDAFAACFIYAMENNESLSTACKYGLTGAALTVQTQHSVFPSLKSDILINLVKEYFS